MKRIIGMCVVVAGFLGLAAPFAPSGLPMQTAVAAEEGSGMGRVHTMLKKLQDAMVSMKDFDELEKAGMSKKQVDRMRRAMQIKINQMMEEVIRDIHAL